MLQCIAVCSSALREFFVFCSMLQCDTVCCSVLQCFAVCCSVLQCVAVLFENFSFFYAITSPNRMAEKEDRKANGPGGNTQKKTRNEKFSSTGIHTYVCIMSPVCMSHVSHTSTGIEGVRLNDAYTFNLKKHP